jgi:predicted solute-binding protein
MTPKSPDLVIFEIDGWIERIALPFAYAPRIAITNKHHHKVALQAYSHQLHHYE